MRVASALFMFSGRRYGSTCLARNQCHLADAAGLVRRLAAAGRQRHQGRIDVARSAPMRHWCRCGQHPKGRLADITRAPGPPGPAGNHGKTPALTSAALTSSAALGQELACVVERPASNSRNSGSFR